MKFAAFFLIFSFTTTVLSEDLYEKENSFPRMFVEFCGKPQIIGEIRIGDKYLIPAHALTVDLSGKCWLDLNCRLNEKSNHLIEVGRFKKNVRIPRVTADQRFATRIVIGYYVHISRKKLRAFRWKQLTIAENIKDKFVAVRILTVGD